MVVFSLMHNDLQGKIVRVLNLWQKNAVYRPEVIQPLLVMASDSGGGEGDGEGVIQEDVAAEPDLSNGAASRLLLQQQKLLEQQQQQLNSLLQAGGVPAGDLAVLLQKAEQLKQLQTLQQQLMKGSLAPPPPPSSSSSIPANGPSTVEQPRVVTHGSEFNEVCLGGRVPPLVHLRSCRLCSTTTLTTAVRRREMGSTNHVHFYCPQTPNPL